MQGNYIHDPGRHILCDQGSITPVGLHHFDITALVNNNILARASLIVPLHPHDPGPDGDTHIGISENHTS